MLEWCSLPPPCKVSTIRPKWYFCFWQTGAGTTMHPLLEKYLGYDTNGSEQDRLARFIPAAWAHFGQLPHPRDRTAFQEAMVATLVAAIEEAQARLDTM